ncbi:MAG: succinate dehydrogenase, hydrophobic membrane anchor protein [Candidatus Marinimicrobia bacterium]|nr:succinate dehydrogenase, hydrophobic membrane anchor protein [Candidatus Neomarinimicrobiota bacterium]
MLRLHYHNEKLRWIFQRVTGLQLLLCAGIHIWVFFFILERPLSYGTIHAVLSHPVWLVFYSVFLFLGIYHGLSGLWTVLTDRNPSNTVKRTLKIILISLGAIFMVLGEWNLIMLSV